MGAGTLDRRITIEQQATIDGDYGPQPGGWAVFASRIPAQVQGVLPSKSESSAQGIRIAVQPARVRIRYMPGITSAMRIIVHDDIDRVMQIMAGPTEILGRRKWLEMMVEGISS